MAALLAAPTLAGCPGMLDPGLASMETGSSGTGGTSSTGGSTGTGGTNNCTGGNDGATVIAARCATSGCHDSISFVFSGGLDLTVDANIGSRLVGVLPTGNDGSVCGGTTKPYLDANSSPATGLLVDKITMSTGAALCPGGVSMPYGLGLLPTAQQNCIVQWATTLTSP